MKPVLFLLFILTLAVNARCVEKSENSITFQVAADGRDESGYRVVLEHDTITVTALRFYISGIKLTNLSGTTLTDTAIYLIDLTDTASVALPYTFSSSTKISAIDIELGIDSATNVAGVMGGDLDPTKGMYWTWQSGYIDFKLEATDSHGKKFEYHLGGYHQPYATFQHVNIKPANASSVIVFSLKNFFLSLSPDEKKEIMSPGEDAYRISRKVANGFKNDPR